MTIKAVAEVMVTYREINEEISLEREPDSEKEADIKEYPMIGKSISEVMVIDREINEEINLEREPAET